MSTIQKMYRVSAPFNINSAFFFCSFDVYRASKPFLSVNDVDIGKSSVGDVLLLLC